MRRRWAAAIPAAALVAVAAAGVVAFEHPAPQILEGRWFDAADGMSLEFADGKATMRDARGKPSDDWRYRVLRDGVVEFTGGQAGTRQLMRFEFRAAGHGLRILDYELDGVKLVQSDEPSERRDFELPEAWQELRFWPSGEPTESAVAWRRR